MNGYKREVEVIHFPLTGKPIYISFFGRRWKKRGKKESSSNQYEFHPKGMKVTREFRDFLKGLPRQEHRVFFLPSPHLRHIWEEDMPVVSRCPERLCGQRLRRILFWEFPEIKEAYDLICSFRSFYRCKVGPRHRARESLDKWYEKTNTSKIAISMKDTPMLLQNR